MDADRAAMQASVGSLDPATSDLPVSDDEFFSSFGGGGDASGPTIDPKDLATVTTTPGVPTAAKRNAIAAGLNTPGVQDDLTARIAGTGQRADQAQAKIDQSQNILDAIFAQRQQDTLASGQLAKAQVLDKQLYAESQAQKNTATLNKFGLNTDDANQAVNQAAARMPDLYQQIYALKDTIAQKAESNFLDDPASWIMNQLTVGNDVQKHNDLVGKYNQTEEYLDAANKAYQATINSNATKMTAMSTNEALDLANQKVLQSQLEAGKIAEEGVKQGILSTEAGQRIQAAATASLQGAEQHQDSMAALDMEREKLNLYKADRLKMAKDKADAEKIIADAKANDAEIQRKRDAIVAAALGTQYNINSEKQLKEQTPKRRAQLEQIVNTYDPNTGYGIYGTTPVDAINNLAGSKKSEIGNPAQVQMAQTIAQMAGNDQATGVLPGDKPEVANDKKNKYIQEQVAKWQSNPTVNGTPLKDGTTWKVFNAAPLAEIATRPSLGGNAVAAQTNLLTAALPPQTEITPSMVMTTIADKVNKGEMDINDAASAVKEFFGYAVKNNNDTLKMDRFGLPPQSSFQVPLQTGQLGGTTRYDLASPGGAYQAILNLVRQSRVGESIAAGAAAGG